MCHEILKEEDDDEVESLDDEGFVVNKSHLDDLLDEQNGNISAKLTSLTLNDNEDSVTGLNGSTNATEGSGDCDGDGGDATKSKKKPKKGTNNKVSGGTECDSNDNKIDEEINESALEANDERLTQSGDIINDDAVNVNA